MAGTTQVDIALQYNDGFNETVFAYANNIHTTDGGTHLTGFRTALTRVLNDLGRKLGISKTPVSPETMCARGSAR